MDEYNCSNRYCFLNSAKLGEEYKNDMFVAGVKKGTIYHFDLNENRTGLVLKEPLSDRIANTDDELENIIFGQGFGLPTYLAVGPDGYLYVLSFFYRSTRILSRIISDSADIE